MYQEATAYISGSDAAYESNLKTQRTERFFNHNNILLEYLKLISLSKSKKRILKPLFSPYSTLVCLCFFFLSCQRVFLGSLCPSRAPLPPPAGQRAAPLSFGLPCVDMSTASNTTTSSNTFLFLRRATLYLWPSLETDPCVDPLFTVSLCFHPALFISDFVSKNACINHTRIQAYPTRTKCLSAASL